MTANVFNTRASGCQKRSQPHITLLDKDNHEIAAETYVIPNPSGRYVPPDSYTRPILSGARQIPLPIGYIEQLESIINGDLQKQS